MNRNAKVAVARLAVMAAAVGALAFTAPHAQAAPSQTATVDGVDYPLCVEEDCSDQPGQIGIWTNKRGEQWLSLGDDLSVRIY